MKFWCAAAAWPAAIGTGANCNRWRARKIEGWYRTGDLGALDEQGNLFFKGRKKEVIVTPAGMNVYPEDLEAALRGKQEVRDCVVVGLERGGNAEPCAVLILRDRNANSPTPRHVRRTVTIVQRANETLAEYQRMRTWFVWPDEDFPRSATQKPRRNVIRDAVEAASPRATAASAASPLPELAESLTRSLAAPQMQNLAPDADLESGLGLSSLERVELLSALEDRYQIDLSETKFANAATVGDLEKLLHNDGAVVSRSSLALVDPPIDQRGRPATSGTSLSSTVVPPFTIRYGRLRWPTTWLRMATHYLLARPAMFLLGWPRVIGRENLRGVRGPLLVDLQSR